MGVRSIKPTTPGNRFATRPDFAEITKSTPEKSLTTALRKTGGRNNKGRITVRHRGGGHRRGRIPRHGPNAFGTTCPADE